MRLFWRKGYAATAISDLTEAMGIGSTSLYAAFGSKEALYAEALLRYGELYDDAVWGRFKTAPTAREAVEALLVDSAGALTSSPGRADPPGCMVTLSNADCEGATELAAMMRAARGAAVERVKDRLARARDEGELPQSLDLQVLARFIVTLQNGMSLQARNGVGRGELEAAARLSLAGWDAWTSAAQSGA
jgi:AcrR family transcriptional regulator